MAAETSRILSVDALERLASLYALLGMAITHPYAETVLRCRELAASIVRGRGGNILAAQASWLADYEPDAVEITALEVEYTRLFVNAYPRTPLPPYESVQRGEDGLWGESTLGVVRLYASAGLRFRQANGVAPDHLSAELEFAGRLLEAAVSAEADPRSQERWLALYEDHVADHLGVWGPTFCRRVEQETRMEFYRAFGRLGAAVLEAEAERVARERRAVCNG